MIYYFLQVFLLFCLCNLRKLNNEFLYSPGIVEHNTSAINVNHLRYKKRLEIPSIFLNENSAK